MYYNVLGAQVAYRMQNRGSTIEAGLKATNRTTGNTLEQMVPFLVSLWLYATYVDVGGAASLGWVYIAARACYGPLWAVYGEFTVLVELSTSPACKRGVSSLSQDSFWPRASCHDVDVAGALHVLNV